MDIDLLLIRDVPTGLMAVLSLVFGALLAMSVTWLAHRLVPNEKRLPNNEVGAVKFAAVAAIYGVVLAFAVVAVWEQFDRAREVSRREADVSLSIARLADGLHPEDGARLKLTMRKYLEQVIQSEWPAMQAANPNEAAKYDLGGLYREVASLPVNSLRGQAFITEILARVDDLGDARRQRIEAARLQMPGLMWYVLLAGAAVLVAFTGFFGMSNVRAQMAMSGLLGATISLALYAILEFNHPYSGSVAVSTDAYEFALANFPKLESAGTPRVLTEP